MAEHLLIVDDDKEICSLLSQFMTQHGYRISVAHEGRTMMQTLESARIDLVVLDVMLPGESGLSLCRRVRSSATIPIVMLTAVGAETDRIVGLEMGADDYLPKPFNPRELLARIRAVLRRAEIRDALHDKNEKRTLYRFGDWVLNLRTRQLTAPGGEPVVLTHGEFSLLAAFLQSPQRVLSREQLPAATRMHEDIFDRSVDAQILRLRRKLEADPSRPALIRTERGVGYIFAAPVQAS
jgi:two-component system, OmpR family, response regulator